MRKDWFEDWFETDYYKLLYRQRDAREASQFADRLVRYLNLPQGAYILDVGCGRGRYARAFAQLGYDVTGIDISFKKTEDNVRHANNHLHFYRHDMRRIFRVNYFDAVLNLFTSFGYFDSMSDEKNAAKCMALNLKTGGFLVIDYLNPEHIKQHFKAQETVIREGITFHIRKSLNCDNICKEIEISDGDQRFHFKEQVRLFGLEDLIQLFKPFRLQLQHVFGNYRLESFENESSERIILIFRKQ
ncbi:MAG: class I SAM-dependent methyltransferase [Saprospiraceae bacterium]|nr:class I SAM-dependent methyltransferase [Saprospiraceae bacterium]